MKDPIAQKYEFEAFAKSMIQNNLHVALERHNLTRSGFAERTGLSKKAVDNWMQGDCVPSLSKALLICYANGWKLSELIGGILDDKKV